jgi:uncharacterized OsmC-like protein
MAEATYRVKATKGLEEFVRVDVRDHSIIIDEPVEKGGTDKGMSPVELLLSSIAACMTITLSVYSEAMGVAVRGIEIRVEGDLNTAGMKGSARVRPGFQRIRMDIAVDTDEDPEVFQQVVDLALLRCPVEDSVKKGVEFEEPRVRIRKITD